MDESVINLMNCQAQSDSLGKKGTDVLDLEKPLFYCMVAEALLLFGSFPMRKIFGKNIFTFLGMVSK